MGRIVITPEKDPIINEKGLILEKSTGTYINHKRDKKVKEDESSLGERVNGQKTPECEHIRKDIHEDRGYGRHDYGDAYLDPISGKSFIEFRSPHGGLEVTGDYGPYGVDRNYNRSRNMHIEELADIVERRYGKGCKGTPEREVYMDVNGFLCTVNIGKSTKKELLDQFAQHKDYGSYAELKQLSSEKAGKDPYYYYTK